MANDSRSPSKSTASAAENSAVDDPIALEIEGPKRRVDSKFSKVTTAGKKIPMAAKNAAAASDACSSRSNNGEISQKQIAVMGTEMEAPTRTDA